ARHPLSPRAPADCKQGPCTSAPTPLGDVLRKCLDVRGADGLVRAGPPGPAFDPLWRVRAPVKKFRKLHAGGNPLPASANGGSVETFRHFAAEPAAYAQGGAVNLVFVLSQAHRALPGARAVGAASRNRSTMVVGSAGGARGGRWIAH